MRKGPKERMNKLRKIIQVIREILAKAPMLKYVFAWHYKHSRVKQHQVLFESFHGKNISDSPLAVLLELLKMDKKRKYKIYFATNNIKRDKKVISDMGLRIRLVDITTFKYAKVLATSKYLINNSSFPAFFIRRPEQTYLQTWHGTPLKTLGKKMRFGIESMYNVQHNFLQATYIMFPNEFTKDVIMEDYNLNQLYTGKVVMNGYPRNSVFLNETKAAEVSNRLGNSEYTTMAYMPTWRGKSNHDVDIVKYSQETEKILAYLDKNLKANQKLYVNFHPMLQQDVVLDKYEHIYPFPNNVEKYEFLNSVDMLITDYSSVFFDFSITRKPIVLFLYDYEEYLHDRGMYFDIKKLPFKKIYNISELVDYIVNEEFRADSYEKDGTYEKTFIQYDSVDAAKKTAKLIFKSNNCGLPIIDYGFNKKVRRKVHFYPAVRTKEALNTVAKVVKNKDDIVIFEKNYFNAELSSYLYDNYLEKFNFIFVTKSMPRTFLEEFRRNKNPQIEIELHKREIKRLFGELPVNSEFIDEYYHGERNETFHVKSKKTLSITITTKKKQLELDFGEIKYGELTKILITDNFGNILWVRNISYEEKKSGKIIENFRMILSEPVLAENKRYLLMAEIKDKEGEIYPYYLVDKKLYHQRKKLADELDKSSLYMDEFNFENAKLAGKKKKEIKVIPYMTFGKGYLSIFVGSRKKLISQTVRGQVISYRLSASDIRIKMKFKKQDKPIRDIVLSYRSKLEKIEYSFQYDVSEEKGYWIVNARMNMMEIDLEELFWDIFLITEKNGEEIQISPYLNKKQRIQMMLWSQHCKAKNEHIVFPYPTMGHKLALTYRHISKYDGICTKMKELSALFVFIVLYPYWRKKRIWLVFEKFCSMAQDNGYFFFKYCMENLIEEEKKHIYYIIDRNSADWNKMCQYGNQVIPFMSFKHILYALASKIYVGSDSKKHLYIWRAKPNFISNRISKKDILFLQHGVTALKRVDGIFGRKGSSPMTYFTTTSEFEQKIVVDNFGYKPENAPILGFTRWDVLEDTSKKDERIILAMPTWRSWLEEKSAEEFKNSDYYYNYMKLLQSKRLAEILKENNVKLVFYIHPKFKDYLSEFNVSGENLELIPFGTEPLNEIMKKCSMLITDYSSVCWDVYYLAKPVLFYQFDYDVYMQVHGSYLDMEHALFGERYIKYEELIDGIKKYVKNDFEEEKKYAEMRDYYFEYRDNNNSKRTYQYIISKGY